MRLNIANLKLFLINFFIMFSKILLFKIAAIILISVLTLMTVILVCGAILTFIDSYNYKSNYTKGNITLEEFCHRYKTRSVEEAPLDCFKLLSK